MMMTLADITKQSIEDICTVLFSDKSGANLDFVQGLPSEIIEHANKLEREYGDLKIALNLSLASYFMSFLALFFHKKGSMEAKKIIKIEPLGEVLAFLESVFVEQECFDSSYTSVPLNKLDFLNHWMCSDDFFSAKRAKENIILDVLIRYDQLKGSRLSSRLLSDIHYIVYFLAMEDGTVSYNEKQLLDFLEQETQKVKGFIGDTSSQSIEEYEESLNAKNTEALLEEAREELDELIGLTAIKSEFNKLEAFLKIQKLREELDLAVTGLTLHFVFRGNPGTGKTTVARILGKLFAGVGFLKNGHVEETDRSGLVAEYVGQTAVKTKAKAEAALDGILFVDEAYSLSRASGGAGGNDAYGLEAIETILKFMEDNRKRIVVVVAGYPKLMNNFIATNPGLKSRFTRYLDFEDFQPIELCQIMQLFAKKGQYHFTDEGVSALAVIITKAFEQRTSGFGNARFVRNLFEETLQNQAVRLASQAETPSKESIMSLSAVDLPKQFENISFDLKEHDYDFLPWCDECNKRQMFCPAVTKAK